MNKNNNKPVSFVNDYPVGIAADQQAIAHESMLQDQWEFNMAFWPRFINGQKYLKDPQGNYVKDPQGHLIRVP